ncbi:hypothetical protein BCR36DRAFT_416720 [Piromyces finnis]|uniref:Chitin-binding type-1 domain-containing protein n=1 Tax=Piromyces finnis TaxID=1754191 RepID=A0A1Y1UU06_9FUNG|nr:hypothetical protein BCR36DRAFT_416720 [Piromyces finnis]|eukprot:ORX41510.1 hypothetical protein BCR36DRAFT_416720 [Piromyces finnis]
MKFINFIIKIITLISISRTAPTYYISDRCGQKYGKCNSGKCCSKYGWCGTSSTYCSISEGCQTQYGICKNGKFEYNPVTLSASEFTKQIITPSPSTNKKSKSKSINSSTSKKNKSVNSLITSSSKKNKSISTPTLPITTNYTPDVTSLNLPINKTYSSITSSGNVKWAGFRYSSYGIEDSFGYIPNSSSWVNYIEEMKSNFYHDTKVAIILIVGVESKTNYCMLEFPKPKNVSDSLNVEFSTNDQYEDFLKQCDKHGYDVWLQVEAGDNDLVKLADIVLDHYGHHSSVKGFGIDCEWWYRNYTLKGNGRPLSDSEAKRIVDAVREKNPKYTVFAKHWEISYMPPTYRDGMLFVNDSQGFNGSLDQMKNEFKEWAQKFSNNPVMFQIGYDDDKEIWEDNPIQVAKAIADVASEYNKEIGIIWVDFTIKSFLNKI